MIHIQFSQPVLEEGMAIYQLVKNCPPLDLNSSYLYFLQASHFAQTCIVAKLNNKIVGWVSGYCLPEDREHFFVWQVAVDASVRGQGLAKQMLVNLLQRPNLAHIQKISTTISPSNLASQALFKSASQQLNATLSCTEFINEAHFQGECHEAEELYTLTLPLNQHLNP